MTNKKTLHFKFLFLIFSIMASSLPVNASILGYFSDYNKSFLPKDAVIQSIENGFKVKNSYFTKKETDTKCFFKEYSDTYNKKTDVYNSKVSDISCKNIINNNDLYSFDSVSLNASEDIAFDFKFQVSKTMSKKEKDDLLNQIKEKIERIKGDSEQVLKNKEFLKEWFKTFEGNIKALPNFSKTIKEVIKINVILDFKGNITLYLHMFENDKEIFYFTISFNIGNIDQLKGSFINESDVERYSMGIIQYIQMNLGNITLGNIGARFNYSHDFTPYKINILNAYSLSSTFKLLLLTGGAGVNNSLSKKHTEQQSNVDLKSESAKHKNPFAR